MDGKTHQLGGVCFGLITTAVLFEVPPTFSTLLMGGTIMATSAIGALVPDIDHPQSKAGKKIGFLSSWISKGFGHRGLIHSPFFALLLLFVALLTYPLMIPFLKIWYWIGGLLVLLSFKKIMRGRKKSGLDWIGWGIALFVLWSLTPEIEPYLQPMYLYGMVGFFVGYLSHLFLDALTVAGVPLFAPISQKKYRLLKLKTGRHEKIATFILIGLTTMTLYLQWLR